MRLNDWEIRLQAYLDNIQEFQWGKTDCCMFSFGAAHAITGIDHRNHYNHTNEKEAEKILLSIGGIEALASLHYGKAKLPTLAMRGEIVSFETKKQRKALGVCVGSKIAAMQKNGLIFLSMDKAINAWSV
jgi:hypothetical protein